MRLTRRAYERPTAKSIDLNSIFGVGGSIYRYCAGRDQLEPPYVGCYNRLEDPVNEISFL